MKNGLGWGDVYGATLQRIKTQGGVKARLGMATLMWVSHSRRPLRVEEICDAVAIRIGSNYLDYYSIPVISTLVGSCQGLATIDKGTSTIKLIHFTLQEYLCTHPDLFDRAHSTMAETCLTYLNFQHIKDFSASPFPDLRITPFLEYSSLYWGAHMQMESSDRTKEFALQLLEKFENHISATLLWKSIIWGFPLDYDPDDRQFSALHCVSYFGIAEAADTLIDTNGSDVNEIDGTGATPLIWAARYGHEEVVELLLQKKDIQPDQQDVNCDRTALSWAAENGHEGVVGLLLEKKEVEPDRLSKSGLTPLLWALKNGHEGVVNLLLERYDIDPNRPGKFGRTPLSWAAENGCEGVVKLLFGREDVDPITQANLDGRRYHMLPRGGMGVWWNSSLDAGMSIPIL